MLNVNLYPDKGTPVRLTFRLSDGKTLSISPLEYSGHGLVISASSAGNAGALKVLGSAGEVVATREIPTDSAIAVVESFVVYPDGSTWAGRILEGNEEEARTMIWTVALARVLNCQTAINEFAIDEWQKRPTIVTILRSGYTPLCMRIEHTCHDCKRFK